VPRLRRADCSRAGLTRRRAGKGFVYLDPQGRRITDRATIDRIEALVLPPAWRELWICPDANGHIQAIGTDAAGRRQYRYHDVWRRQRDLAKFDKMLDFAELLPALREALLADLDGNELTERRVLACAIRLLDLGFFRVGSEEYAETNGTFGLATLRKEHVSITDGVITFDFVAKSGKHRVQSVGDEQVLRAVRSLKQRRGGGPELLAYREGRSWRDVKSADVNAHLRELTGADVTAKDFRTWNATVLAAVGLSVSEHAAATETGRKRAIVRAVKEVAEYLGNTPAVARSSYIDPRVIDRFSEGVTISQSLGELGAEVSFGQLATQGAVESATLELLRGTTRAQQARRRAATVRRARQRGDDAEQRLQQVAKAG